MKKPKYTDEWLSDKVDTPEFQRAYERELLIEGYLDQLDQAMKEEDVTRSELAQLAGCSRANITQALDRRRNLTAETMVDLAFYLGKRVVCQLRPRYEPVRFIQDSPDWTLILNDVSTEDVRFVGWPGVDVAVSRDDSDRPVNSTDDDNDDNPDPVTRLAA